MNQTLEYEICILGLGPAGIGAALTFQKNNLSSNVICVDAGCPPDLRTCSLLNNNKCIKDNPCNILSGFGGCSLLSGGKISNFPAGSSFEYILGSRDKAQEYLSATLDLLKSYVPLKKPRILQKDIDYAYTFFEEKGFEFKYYDAYLFDEVDLKRAYNHILAQLKDSGMDISLNTKVIDLDIQSDNFIIKIQNNKTLNTIIAKKVFLGLGRLGENFLKALNNKFSLKGTNNNFDAGVRLEFPTEFLTEIFKYHNDLKLKFNNARTYCVSKDGKILSYMIDDSYFTEGYVNLNHNTGFTNLAILYRFEPSLLNDEYYQQILLNTKSLSNGIALYQNLIDYIKNADYIKTNNVSTNMKSFIEGNMNKCFPESMSEKIRNSVQYFVTKLIAPENWDKINVFGPELDYMSISFPVGSDFSLIPGLYVIGSSTGKFRGILQAFTSGIISAESMLGSR